jgi:nitrilase
MNPTFKVAAIQMVSGISLTENLATATRLIAQAAAEGANLVALPEYFCLLGLKETDKLSIAEDEGSGPIQALLASTAKEHGIWLAAGSIPLKTPEPSRVFNTQLVFNPAGESVVRYDKVHLFSFSRGDESYDESRAIAPGRDIKTFESPIGRVGLSICYDLRFPEIYRAMGPVNLILVPSAFTFTTGQAHWELLLRARAVENQAYVLAPAQGGQHQNGRRTWGRTMLIDPWGEVLAVLNEQEGVVSGTIDPLRLSEVRQALPALKHRIF